MMQGIRIAGVALLALIVLIIVLPNTESVDTKILFLSITMPRAALLSGALVVVFVIGVFTADGVLARMQEKAPHSKLCWKWPLLRTH